MSIIEGWSCRGGGSGSRRCGRGMVMMFKDFFLFLVGGSLGDILDGTRERKRCWWD